MNRRSFMAALLAAGTAPAIVKAGSLMRVNPAIVGVAPLVGWTEHSGFDFYTTPLTLHRKFKVAMVPYDDGSVRLRLVRKSA